MPHHHLGSAPRQAGHEQPDWVFLTFGNDGFSVDAQNNLVSPPTAPSSCAALADVHT
jgi:hypothetical protein